MYNNSGAKVKGLATTITTLTMIGSVMLGLIIIIFSESFFAGLIFAVVGCFVAWLTGLMLAAFGEMVENTYHLRKMLAEKLDYKVKEDKVSEKPDDNNDTVTDEEIRAIMHRDGIGIGDAMHRAAEEKLANIKKGSSVDDSCPNCGSPRKGNGAFCSSCGAKLK